MPSHYLNQCWNIVNLTIENKIQSKSKFIYFNSRKYLWNCRLFNQAVRGAKAINTPRTYATNKNEYFHTSSFNDGLLTHAFSKTSLITVTSYWTRWRLNHQPHDCLLNRLFRRRSKKTSKPRVTGLCVGNSPVTGEFPAQMACNAENVSI